MGIFDCKSKDAEIFSLQKKLDELRGDLFWYINKYGVKSASMGGSRKRKTKRTKHRSRRTRV